MPSVPYQNYIPVYETDESLNPINAFPTDDYYALLSNNEGANLKGALDVRVGRLTVSTAEEADQVVDKIIRYDVSSERFGEWKLKTGFCADDEDGNLHINDADTIAKEAFEKDPLINQQRSTWTPTDRRTLQVASVTMKLPQPSISRWIRDNWPGVTWVMAGLKDWRRKE